MSEALFTVVIPLYNKSGHIAETLGSVLQQRQPPFEIIVVDDGSSDPGPEIVTGIQDARIRLIRQKNSGVSSARNRGAAAARSPWVTFLDADDYLHPAFLQTLTELIRRHPDVDVVAAQYRSIAYQQGVAMADWAVDENAAVERIDDLPRRWMAGACFFTSSVGVRLATLKSLPVMFPEGESYGEDLDLWFRLGERSTIAMSGAPLVARVWVPGGLSTGAASMLDPPYVLRMIERIGSPDSRLTAVQRTSLAQFVRHRWVSLARTAIGSGDRRSAVSMLRRAAPYGLHKRWWVTALMAVAVPGSLVHSWQHWRKRRKMIVG